MAFVAVVLLFAVRMAARPYLALWMAQRQQEAIDRKMLDVQKENRNLRFEVMWLASENGKRGAAHDRGWVAPGEVRFNTPSSVAATGYQRRVLEKISRWDRFMFFLCRLAGVTVTNPQDAI